MMDGQRTVIVVPELQNTCFICKSSLKINRKNKPRSSTRSILGCSHLQAILKIWELPADPSQADDEEKSTIQFCWKCHKTVKQILKIVQDINHLQKQLLQMKIRVEGTIRDKFNVNVSDNVSAFSSERKDDTVYMAEDMLRRQIILKSKGFEGGHVIRDERDKQTVSGKRKHPQKSFPIKKKKRQPTPRKEVNNPVEIVEPDEKLDIQDLETPGVCETYKNIEPGCEELETIETEAELLEHQGDELLNTPDQGLDALRGTEGNMTTNIDIEVDEFGLKCSQCRCSFKDELGRMAHIRKLHQGATHPYFCDTCDKKFKSKRQLMVHQMTHTGESPFICEHCGKGFREEKVLRLHLKLMHIGGLKYNCEICGRGFLTPSKLKTHEISHSKKYPVNCSDCGKGFVSKTALNIHSHKHMAVNPFECADCNKTYSSARALDFHRSIHTLEFKYRCTICPYGTSTSKADLERHILKHQSEKLLECNICNKKFKYKKTLQKHLKIHEGRERKFQCSLCGKSFFENHQLVKHIRTHEDNRPFSCEICDKRFNFKQYLTEHLKVHERIRMQNSANLDSATTYEPKSTYSVIFQQEYNTEHTDPTIPLSIHQDHSEPEEPSSRNHTIICDLETDTDMLSVNLYEASYLNL